MPNTPSGERPSATDAAAPSARAGRLTTASRWLIGGGVLVLIVAALIVWRVLAPNESSPSSAPAASDAPADAGLLLPEEVTFAAGADLPPTLQPSFTPVLASDPAWVADPGDTDQTDGRNTFRHAESGCQLVTYQTLATDLTYDPADDYSNSITTLLSLYGADDIGAAPGSYFFAAGPGESRVEAAAVLTRLDSGAGELTTARGFGRSNIALITRFTCPDAATTAGMFETLAVPAIVIAFTES
jgi:hypothetical protein